VASHGTSGTTSQAQEGTTAGATFWSKSKGDPNKANPAPKGWDWVPVKNKEGVFVGYMLTRDTSETSGNNGNNTSGTSSGSSSGYGGSSSSSASPGLSAYIQAYRIMFDATGVKPPAELLKRAEAGNWSIAYWNMQVRLNDKKYFASAEAKKNLAELRNYWKAVLPGTKLNMHFAKDYLRHGWNETQLQDKISQLPSFQRQYPFWKAFAAAQRKVGAAKMVNPLAYKQYAAGFADVYKQAGALAPQGYEELFFRSGLSDDEFVKNYSILAQTANAAQWDVGGLNEQQKQSELFSGKGANQVRGLLQTALNKQQRYFQSNPTGFRIGETDNPVTVKGL